MALKYLPSYYSTTKAPNNNDFLIFCYSILGVRSHESKCITKNKNSLMIATNTTIKKQNSSNLFILVTSIKSIYNHKSKYTNSKNNNNRQNGTLLYICTIKCQHL